MTASVTNVIATSQPKLHTFPSEIHPPPLVYTPGFECYPPVYPEGHLKCRKGTTEGELKMVPLHPEKFPISYPFAASSVPLRSERPIELLNEEKDPVPRKILSATPVDGARSPMVLTLQGKGQTNGSLTFTGSAANIDSTLASAPPQLFHGDGSAGEVAAVGSDAQSNTVIETTTWKIIVTYLIGGMFYGFFLNLVGLLVACCLLKAVTEKKKRIPFFAGVVIGSIGNFLAISFRMFPFNNLTP